MLRLISACIAVAALAVLLDGAAPLPHVLGAAPLWIDLAAIVCVLAGTDWRALRAGEDPGTPMDTLLLGAIAVAAIQAAAHGGREGSGELLAQALSGGGIYLGLTRALRRAPESIEVVWRVLAASAIALGLHAVWVVTGGLAHLGRVDAVVDVRWAGHDALAKTCAFLALVLAGRALERGASPFWRLAALLGVLGTGLHVAAGGFGLGSRSLARLDDPQFFCTLSLTLLLVLAVARTAWETARQRPAERARWRGLALASVAMGIGGALGQASGGEGVRLFMGLAAASVMTVRALPAAPAVPMPELAPVSRSAPEAAPPGEMARAA